MTLAEMLDDLSELAERGHADAVVFIEDVDSKTFFSYEGALVDGNQIYITVEQQP